MYKEKSFKDAVHGYIQIDEPFWRIIDTASFQRLKWVEQTSYRPLFPAARHDRFIHSIGVFHLGKRAIDGFLKNSDENDRKIIKKYKESFLLSCLLHDLGHAPFSHTSEKLFNYLYKMNDFDSPLVQELLGVMKDRLDIDAFNKFSVDYKNTIIKNHPAEHEVMSSILICRLFDSIIVYFKNSEFLDIDLIVRAIIGCSYSVKPKDDDSINREMGIKNCLIRLLNSSSIDVDKLDYIARDTLMTGYDTISIDIDRLLDSVSMIRNGHVYYPSYKKSALSVINNVFTAKGLQAKWIVNHPTNVYDSYILQKAMIQSLKRFAQNLGVDGDGFIRSMFSADALLETGIDINGFNVSLVSDIDILFILKQNFDNPIVKEYFSRNMRKRPIWKSYEEYLYFLGLNKDKIGEIYLFLAPLFTLGDNQELGEVLVINEELKTKIEKARNIENPEVIIEIIDTLLGFDENSNEYIILPPNSSFRPKIDFKSIYIKFSESDTSFAQMSQFENSTIRQEDTTKDFFYLYSNNKIEPARMIDYLYEKAVENVEVRA